VKLSEVLYIHGRDSSDYLATSYRLDGPGYFVILFSSVFSVFCCFVMFMYLLLYCGCSCTCVVKVLCCFREMYVLFPCRMYGLCKHCYRA
jgi:hypothetical protein